MSEFYFQTYSNELIQKQNKTKKDIYDENILKNLWRSIIHVNTTVQIIYPCIFGPTKNVKLLNTVLWLKSICFFKFYIIISFKEWEDYVSFRANTIKTKPSDENHPQ